VTFDAAAEFQREARTCPACGALSRVVPHRVLRFACGVCGAPRAPPSFAALAGSDLVERSLVPAMHAVRSARAAALGWRAGGGVLVAAAIMGLGLGALLFFASHFAALMLFAFGGAFAGMAAMAASRGRRAEAAGLAKLDGMWEAFAEAALRARAGAATAAELARLLGTDEAVAERLLAGIAVKSDVAQELGEDAELRYRVGGAAGKAEEREEREREMGETEEGEAERRGETPRRTGGR
jgi:ribosomal protein S27AE